MPACARKEIVRQGKYGIYHCWSRCVRRAFLLGHDKLTGNDYNHRREWIIERLRLLVSNFVIDVGFLAILSNHFHVVLRTNPRRIKRMGDWEIARRWLRVYPGRRVLDGKWPEPTEEQVKELAADKDKIKKLRKRLSNISWFMAALSEYIARRSNAEDDCTGRFWEGRFGCREVTDESALLICGLYVDLNQIRAGEALMPEESEHCSIWYRIQAYRQLQKADWIGPLADHWLAPLTLQEDELGDGVYDEESGTWRKGLLPLSLEEYLTLLDFTGRQIREGKKGAIPADVAPILERLGVEPGAFVLTVKNFPKLFRRMAGRAEQMTERAAEAGRRWFQGVRHAACVFT